MLNQHISIQVWWPEGDPSAGPFPRWAATLQQRWTGFCCLVHPTRHAWEQEWRQHCSTKTKTTLLNVSRLFLGTCSLQYENGPAPPRDDLSSSFPFYSGVSTVPNSANLRCFFGRNVYLSSTLWIERRITALEYKILFYRLIFVKFFFIFTFPSAHVTEQKMISTL